MVLSEASTLDKLAGVLISKLGQDGGDDDDDDADDDDAELAAMAARHGAGDLQTPDPSGKETTS